MVFWKFASWWSKASGSIWQIDAWYLNGSPVVVINLLCQLLDGLKFNISSLVAISIPFRCIILWVTGEHFAQDSFTKWNSFFQLLIFSNHWAWETLFFSLRVKNLIFLLLPLSNISFTNWKLSLTISISMWFSKKITFFIDASYVLVRRHFIRNQLKLYL